MKIRNLFVLFTILLFLTTGVCFWKIGSISAESTDMVEMNESLKQIEAALKECTAADLIEELEARYDCTILFYTDKDYQSGLNKAIKQGAVVLDYEENGTIIAKVCFYKLIGEFEHQKKELRFIVLFVSACIWLIGAGVLFYIYKRYLVPFRRLRSFAGEVARGNLDMPLLMPKRNYFGAFTESFDIMREELKAAKENEYRANISKKELVAELSHDIKTPVATIKAACEILQITGQNEAVLEKIRLIDAKAAMIEQLIGNLFHATLEELEVLKVLPSEEASTCIEEMFLGLTGYGNLQIENHIPECLLIMDKLRMNQVVDNIVNNAFKYAKTAVYVSFSSKEDGVGIRIRDEGSGVPEEDLARVTEKFYRGHNANGESGSGLGLYLAKLFMEKMQGHMTIYNDNGFVVELYLRKA